MFVAYAVQIKCKSLSHGVICSSFCNGRNYRRLAHLKLGPVIIVVVVVTVIVIVINVIILHISDVRTHLGYPLEERQQHKTNIEDCYS
jgi:hypothetical protein